MHWRYERYTDNVYLMKDFLPYLVTKQLYGAREKTVIVGLQN